MKTDDRKDYVTKDQLHDALVQSHSDGAPSVQLCECIRHMANVQAKHPNFVRYAEDLKEDMKSYALLKCLKNLHNIDTARSKAACWNYIYTCIRCAFIEVIGKEYKQRNIVRDYSEHVFSEAAAQIPGFSGWQTGGDR